MGSRKSQISLSKPLKMDLISSKNQPREGCKEKFKSNKKGLLVLGEFPNEFDRDEWKW